MLGQRRRRWADVVYMLGMYKFFFVFTARVDSTVINRAYIYIMHHNVGPITQLDLPLYRTLYSLVISHTLNFNIGLHEVRVMNV